jgi:hypothetical protein
LRILRPALIGLFIAAVVGGSLVLFPQATEDSLREGNERARREEVEEREYERRAPLLRLTKAPSRREVTPNAKTPFSLSIENIGEETLNDLRVEERFDGSFLSVADTGGGTVGTNALAWNIDSLRGGERWLTTYRLHTALDAPRGALETTALVSGDDLRGTPTSSRMATSVLTVIPLPRTGVQIPWWLRVLP